jgi:tRNA (mo5U34)-methyltransferase
MGILYHQRSPLHHLQTLRDTLKPEGELVLETLVIPEDYGETLIPEKRYAKMRNVWSIPSCSTLESWLQQSGFKDVRQIDVTQTTIQEQRRTDWMTFHSLENFLHPEDHSQTIEGYPAPQRGIFIAKAPT